MTADLIIYEFAQCTELKVAAALGGGSKRFHRRRLLAKCEDNGALYANTITIDTVIIRLYSP